MERQPREKNATEIKKIEVWIKRKLTKNKKNTCTRLPYVSLCQNTENSIDISTGGEWLKSVISLTATSE